MAEEKGGGVLQLRERKSGQCWEAAEKWLGEGATVRDAEMTMKIIFERSSQRGWAGGSKRRRGSKRRPTGDPP